jgi:hypothetical protein
MLTMNTADAVKMLNQGSKILSWHVVSELGCKPRRIIEEALDWSADLKAVPYLQAYREKFGKYPRCIRFAYLKGPNGENDVYIVNKAGEIIL